MLLIRRIEITNFACFDHIEIEPSIKPEKPLTVIRAENGSGKTTLLRAIRWGMYGEQGLPGVRGQFSVHPAEWRPDANGIQTSVSILFETDGSSRDNLEGNPRNTAYELRRCVTTVSKKPAQAGEQDFHRIDEQVQLMVEEPDGSWLPHDAGADSVIAELLPLSLQDFFVMDADEAADYVGGSENKIISRQEVITKTSSAVRALLGLDVFKKSASRVDGIARDFGRAATKAINNEELNEKQSQLERLRNDEEKLKLQVEDKKHAEADLQGRLERARERLESLLENIGAHDELSKTWKRNRERRERCVQERQDATVALSKALVTIELLGSLAAREIRQVRSALQPLYDNGSIPIRHLEFVKSLLETGTCVCGQDLVSDDRHRRHVENIVAQSDSKQEKADYLAQVLHAANIMDRHRDGSEWQDQCSQLEDSIAQYDNEISVIDAEIRDIKAKIGNIDEEQVQNTRDEIDMLETNLRTIQRDLTSEGLNLEQYRRDINKIDGIIRDWQKKKREAKYLGSCQETALVLMRILNQAYATIRDEQVRELSSEMNRLFGKMVANVPDDETIDSTESSGHKTTLRMIANVGLRPLDGDLGEFEIFAMNSRGRSMPPTEINGASRRILALSFVLALCKLSRTLAPLVADSLLNFMSGTVRTNTLQVTSETASQPILLLTGSDLESSREVGLVQRHAGATYTLTGQWQHVDHGGDVVNQTVPRQVSLICPCGPREFCVVCERQGQSQNPEWIHRAYGENRQ